MDTPKVLQADETTNISDDERCLTLCCALFCLFYKKFPGGRARSCYFSERQQVFQGLFSKNFSRLIICDTYKRRSSKWTRTMIFKVHCMSPRRALSLCKENRNGHRHHYQRHYKRSEAASLWLSCKCVEHPWRNRRCLFLYLYRPVWTCVNRQQGPGTRETTQSNNDRWMVNEQHSEHG